MLAVVSICGIVFSLYHYLLIIIFLVGIIIYAQFNLLTKKKYIKAEPTFVFGMTDLNP